MSIDMARIDNAVSIQNLDEYSRGVDFKIQTQMTDMDTVESILQNKLMGFKNKRDLKNFQNQGNMFFYTEDNTDKISILFMGDYTKNDAIIFVDNLYRQYRAETNPTVNYEQTSSDVDFITEEVKKEPVKSFKITSNMKNRSVIQSILDTSFLGYTSKVQVDEFKNKGKIILNKTDDGSYDVIFLGEYDQKEAENFVNNLSDEYANKIQEITYEKVLEKIREKNYSLESELVDNNDSIVLTLKVD